MKAIEILMHEHVLVRRLLRCLGALTMETRIVGKLEREAATPLFSLFERFVDWSHQDKEELHLFPHLLARATPDEAERLSRVLADHAQERRRLTAMYLHMEGASRGEPRSVQRFIANSLLYQRHQRKHIDAEEAYVLPLGEAILTAEDDRRILSGFRDIDRRLGNIARRDEKITAMCQRFGLQDVEATAPAVPEMICA